MRCKIEYRATTDKPTVLNPTNHSYFNLKGAGNGDVLNHRLQVFSDAVTPTDANHMATGEVMKVAGTGFDFTQPKPIGKDINGPDPAIVATPGYDINFIVRGPMGTAAPRRPCAGAGIRPGDGCVDHPAGHPALPAQQ